MNNGYCEAIPRSGYYITSTGKKVILEPSDIIDVSDKDIIELVLPYGAERVYCWDNNLTKLDLQSSVKKIDCSNNKLTKLNLPDNIEWVHCFDNQLTELDLPDSVEEVFCDNNQLTELIIPDNCIVKHNPRIVKYSQDVKIITRTMYNRSKRLKNILK